VVVVVVVVVVALIFITYLPTPYTAYFQEQLPTGKYYYNYLLTSSGELGPRATLGA